MKLNPIERTGALRVRPNWRYEVLLNPATCRLQGYASVPPSDSRCLTRFLSAGLMYEVNYKVPAEIKRYMNALPPAQAEKLYSLWNRAFKRSKRKRISIDTDTARFARSKIWNMTKIERLNDKFLIRAIKHISNYVHDQHIAYALELNNSAEHSEIFKFIGYGIYAKISDTDIARRWQIPVRSVEAIRLLFFDFSSFPKDRVANFTYLRQLANNGTISDLDFAYYKRVFELGELGLKAQTDFFSLTNEEKRVVEEYLGKSIIATTLNLNFSLRNQKDANNYGMAVSNLATYYIKRSEMTYFEAKTRNLEVQTRRIEGAMADADDGLSDMDKYFMKVLKEHSMQEEKIEYKTIASLN